MAIACALIALPASGADLEPGFDETILAEPASPGNFSQMAWASDGSLFLGNKGGEIYRLTAEQLAAGDQIAERIYRVQTVVTGERGMNGMAVDPDFATNGHLWLYYTTREPHRNVVSRLTYDGQTLRGERVMVAGPLTVQTDHNAGGLAFGADKTLYVAMGDDFQGSDTAQDTFDLRGKILRLNRDGSAPADNPFSDGVGGHPLVWAWGLRNPYRIDMQPDTDTLFIADVGGAHWEELNLGIAGANYGWSTVEGPNPPGLAGYVYPIYFYSHNGAGAAIIGGDHADHGDFAPEFEGDYFYAEFVQRELWRVLLDENNVVEGAERIATDFGYVTDMEFGPDGALYYICRSCAPTTLRKISYNGGDNRQPVARIAATPASGEAPLDVTLDGSGSSDADGDPLTFAWDLGDATASSEPVVAHTYDEGVYEVRLTVEDDRGGLDRSPVTRIVSGNRAPVAVLTSPVDESSYRAGETYQFAGSGVDPEDGDLDCSRLTWQVLFHHNTHTHPALGPLSGVCAGEFTVPAIGERDPGQWFSVRLDVRDSGAPLGAGAELLTSAMAEMRPRLATMTFESAPIPFEMSLDTVPFVGEISVLGVAGAIRRVGTEPAQIGSDGRPYRFRAWSDGGAIEHEIVTPDSDETLVAEFACVPREPGPLSVVYGSNKLELTWQLAPEECLASSNGNRARYRVYAGSTARPTGAARFPLDPAFRLVGDSATGRFSFVPRDEDQFLIVVGINEDGDDGQTGHWGF